MAARDTIRYDGGVRVLCVSCNLCAAEGARVYSLLQALAGVLRTST